MNAVIIYPPLMNAPKSEATAFQGGGDKHHLPKDELILFQPPGLLFPQTISNSWQVDTVLPKIVQSADLNDVGRGIAFVLPVVESSAFPLYECRKPEAGLSRSSIPILRISPAGHALGGPSPHPIKKTAIEIPSMANLK